MMLKLKLLPHRKHTMPPLQRPTR